MNNDRLLSFLGLCMRAGYLVWGAQTVAESVASGKARLVLYASDASPNSLKKVMRAAEANNTPVRGLGRSKEELGLALGRHCGIICTTDAGFAEKINDMIPLPKEA